MDNMNKPAAKQDPVATIIGVIVLLGLVLWIGSCVANSPPATRGDTIESDYQRRLNQCDYYSSPTARANCRQSTPRYP